MARLRWLGVLAVLLLPLGVLAQPAGKVYRIGYLSGQPKGSPTERFIGALRQLGYVTGQNAIFEMRHADGDLDRLPELAAQLLGSSPDVIVAVGNAPATAAKQATATIPLVMIGVIDPVAAGLVASLAHPGGNLTGLSWDASPEEYAKRWQLFKEAVPGVVRVGVVWDGRPALPVQRAPLQVAMQALQLQPLPRPVRRADELPGVFASLAADGATAALVYDTAFTIAHQKEILALAAKHRIATMHQNRSWCDAGGLLSYEPNQRPLARRAAEYVDRILRGAKPADLPVEQPTIFELVVNLKTARSLGLTISQSLLLRADDVIQ